MSGAIRLGLISCLAAVQCAPLLAQADQKPVYTVRVVPQYPARALAEGLEGRCEARFSVDAQGVPQNVTVNCTSPLFDQAVLNAVNRSRFDTRTIETGKPVTLPLSFKLANEPPPSNGNAEPQ